MEDVRIRAPCQWLEPWLVPLHGDWPAHRRFDVCRADPACSGPASALFYRDQSPCGGRNHGRARSTVGSSIPPVSAKFRLSERTSTFSENSAAILRGLRFSVSPCNPVSSVPSATSASSRTRFTRTPCSAHNAQSAYSMALAVGSAQFRAGPEACVVRGHADRCAIQRCDR